MNAATQEIICPVSSAEQIHDQLTAKNSVSDFFVANEQMDAINEMAKKLLAGFPHTTTRAVSVWNLGKHHTEIRPLTFSMQHVCDLVSENLTPQLCAGLLHSEPSAIFSVQQIINEAAREVSFDALNLWSSPFIDYESLKQVAEHGDDK